MRVTYLAQVKKGYQVGRGGCGAQLLIKSLSALRNFIQQSDRDKELPIEIKQEGANQGQQLPNDLPDPNMPATASRAYISQNNFFMDGI